MVLLLGLVQHRFIGDAMLFPAEVVNVVFLAVPLAGADVAGIVAELAHPELDAMVLCILMTLPVVLRAEGPSAVG